MSKEKRRVPKLRFPGFTEDWEQHKLSEVVTINPKTELPDEFKYVDLESVVGTNLLGFQVVKKENAPSRAQRLASYGDVFYQTVRPYQRNNYLFENVDKNMVFSTGYAQLRSKLDSYFLLTLVQNDNFVKVVLDNCTGTSYPAINGSALGKITVRIPSNEVEANQIGKVFRGIDKNITLHQRKLEHLNLKKKALLQKLFPKNGARYPELRFPGFTDAWEQRKLGDTNTFFTDGNYGNDYPTANEMSDSVNGVPFLRGSNLNNGAINLVDVNYITKQKHNLLTSGHTKFDDIIIAVRGSLGNCGYVAKQFIDININSQLAIIRTDKNELSGLFLIEYLLSSLGKKEINRNITGTALKQLPINSLKMINIKYPSINEQEKISILLSKLNASITLHQRKLEHLQLQKKALLQQMFV